MTHKKSTILPKNPLKKERKTERPKQYRYFSKKDAAARKTSSLAGYVPPNEPCAMGFFKCERGLRHHKIVLTKNKKCNKCRKEGGDVRYKPFRVPDLNAFVPVENGGKVDVDKLFEKELADNYVRVKKHRRLSFMEIGDMAFLLQMELDKEKKAA